MRRAIFTCIVLTSLTGVLQPQAKDTQLLIPSDTPLLVQTIANTSSKHAKENDVVAFRVVEPVYIDSLPVIQQGAKVTGRVVTVRASGFAKGGGKLAIALDSVELIDGTKVRVRARHGEKTSSAATAGAAAAGVMGSTTDQNLVYGGAIGVVSLPFVIPIALLAPNNVDIPAGRLITAYVNEDATVDREKVKELASKNDKRTATVFLVRQKNETMSTWIVSPRTIRVSCDKKAVALMEKGDVVELELAPGKHVMGLERGATSKDVDLEGGRSYVLIVGLTPTSVAFTEGRATLREVLPDEMMQIKKFDPKKRPGIWSEIMAQ